LGKLVERQRLQFEIPVQYDGQQILDVESELHSNYFAVAADNSKPASAKQKFLIYVNTLDLSGPFTIPLRLRFRVRNESAFVDRSLTIKGDVFTPITFRQVPENGPITSKAPISVFIRNNTSEAVAVIPIGNEVFDTLSSPDVLPPNSESEVVLQLHAGATPQQLVILTQKPLYGLSHFIYRFRTQ
jgi:hypothetical protein